MRPVGVERLRAAARPAWRRPGRAGGGLGDRRDRRAVEVELALGAAPVGRELEVGVAAQQLVEHVAGARPGRAGRRRAWCRGAARSMSAPMSSSDRISGLASWPATGPCRRARHRSASTTVRRAGRPGATRPRRARRRSRRRGRRARSGPAARSRRLRRRRARRPASPSSAAAAAVTGVDDGDLGLEHVDRGQLGGPAVAEAIRERLGQPVARACGTRGSRRARAPRRGRTRPARGRRATRRGRRRGRSTIISALVRACASCSTRFCAQLRRLLVEVGEDAVEVAVGVDQLGRGLLAHPGHAGQVVGGVAAQRGVLRRTGRVGRRCARRCRPRRRARSRDTPRLL